MFLKIDMVTTDVHAPSPWPLVIELHPEGISGVLVHGRPDAINLIGAAHPETPQTVKFFAERFANEPDLAIGFCPVFVDGVNLFAVPSNIIVDVKPYDVDPEAIANLRKQNDRHRMSFATFTTTL